MSTRPWHIYLPHWSVQERALGGPKGVTLRALQETFLKASTALSWELGDEDRLYVRPLAELQAVRVGEVLDPAERARHSGSPDHRVVELTQASEGAALAGDALWFVCRAHWAPGPHGRALAARRSTWLARSRAADAQGLPAHLKLVVSAGEALSLLEEPAAGGEEVSVGREEVLRLRTLAPRQPLCRYFSPCREELLANIHACFRDAAFGPGCEAPRPWSAPWLEAGARRGQPPPVALLLPHGGYCNSGFVAAHGFRLLADAPSPVAVIVGNNHKSWHKFSLTEQRWSTPLGVLEPDVALVRELREAGYPLHPAAHADEHSIENQLPFLQAVRPDTRIAPVGVGAVSLEEAERLAEVIATLVTRHGAMLLGTTDFSHEGPSYGGPAMPMAEVTAVTREKDRPLLDTVLRMDAGELLRLGASSSMCGAGAAAVLLLACGRLGLTSCELLRYLVNTEVTPCGSTTGFASFAFRRPRP